MSAPHHARRPGNVQETDVRVSVRHAGAVLLRAGKTRISLTPADALDLAVRLLEAAEFAELKAAVAA